MVGAHLVAATVSDEEDKSEVDAWTPEAVPRYRGHHIEPKHIAPYGPREKAQANAWFEKNWNESDEARAMQQLQDTGKYTTTCPRTLPSIWWLCPDCNRKTILWDLFHSPSLGGWGRMTRCSRRLESTKEWCTYNAVFHPLNTV